jgi:hypothetical protein
MLSNLRALSIAILVGLLACRLFDLARLSQSRTAQPDWIHRRRGPQHANFIGLAVFVQRVVEQKWGR